MRSVAAFSIVDGALFGIKAAVLVIVVEALIRIGKRALKTSLLIGLALAAFIGIFFFALPFPLIVAAAALIGFLVARASPELLGRQDQYRGPHAAGPGSLAAGHHRRRRRACGLGRADRARACSRSGRTMCW